MNRARSDIQLGTIIDFEPASAAGLVEGDDGQILLLRAADVIPDETIELVSGRRVHFLQEESTEGPRAVVLAVIDAPCAARCGVSRTRQPLRTH
ncbi:MAG: hypothetical protein ABW110_08080 [Steroidobacteraceae bacterium]